MLNRQELSCKRMFPSAALLLFALIAQCVAGPAGSDWATDLEAPDNSWYEKLSKEKFDLEQKLIHVKYVVQKMEKEMRAAENKCTADLENLEREAEANRTCLSKKNNKSMNAIDEERKAFVINLEEELKQWKKIKNNIAINGLAQPLSA